MTIQWFPGHMAKAKRQVQEKLKLVDFVIELVDARAPYSSQNPMLHKVIQDKARLVVLMKKDLADPDFTDRWVSFYRKNHAAVAVDVQQSKDISAVVSSAKELGQDKLDKLLKKGIRPRPARAMIIGIPNVGKSTLINRLAHKKIAKTGDRPGVTTQQQWIKVKKDFELLDTPGILWPKFEDQEVGYRLAAIGTIKDQLLTLEDIAAFVIRYMQEHYPNVLKDRFAVDPNVTDMVDIFEQIGRKRGCLESGGRVNFEKTADIIIRDVRSGRLGRLTLESPDQLFP
ncbi:ribosome biogenesis GTPase YlqF [Aquibacillus sp. 3ASR75-11]|uniref:Ribosome biogenesis GTPase A n=1 Tax=Terrihalobacillus insolitus TaxID=2950438 RepID=A0A9X4AKY5_9BACI|nr:ribosome biogenesis GTPase YlqF [Terrihalobacillus insolitus]MDC3414154.1 ribosome biogenesis GTPase YlqF [Terrihalobacillus insolitus]MDC3423596.1 ribosome biogenesis GTPase YlqF [Terrihalobacillus insolitus]